MSENPDPKPSSPVGRVLNYILIVLAIVAVAAAGWRFLRSPIGPLVPTPDEGMADASSEPFEQRMREMEDQLEWKTRSTERKLDKETVLASLELDKQFLLNNQKPEGNFNYQYDFVNKTFDKDDNQVRQAGALWGIALMLREMPDEATFAAVKKGIDFFAEHTKEWKDGRTYIKYPGNSSCDSGTVALVALALIESLRSDYAIPDDLRADWNAKLDGYLAFLQAMQLDNGHISRGFNTLTKTSSRGYSPYYDGESLLAMVKAAKYLDRKSLVPTIEKAARAMAETYTVKAWAKNRDSDQTKGFYQWGSMSFEEYGGAGWKDADLYEDITLVLGWWMIHTHQTLRRTRNTAYAHEGIASAYAIAKRRENKAAMNDLGFAIDYGLSKLISWQVEGPLIKENRFLQAHRTDDPIAVGGVMNHRSEAPLRIDVTQHQSHALLLALQHLYSD